MAATVLSPAAALAQHGHGRGNDHGERGQRVEARAQQHSENRQQRQEARPQRAQPQAQPQAVVRTPQVQQRQAFVQRQRGDRGDRGGNRNRGARPGSIYPQAWQGNPNDPRLRHYEQLERQNQYRYGTEQQRREIRQSQGRRGDRDNDRSNNWRGDRNGSNWRGDRNGHRDWNRGWRNDRRYDWQRYRVGNRRLFRLSPYYAPYRNWSYRRFGIGFILDPLFYSRSYWISDPFYYRLPPAPEGTEWVRYYNDVLLVDIYTGEVLDSIYDFFY
jgi:hypothetical protein